MKFCIASALVLAVACAGQSFAQSATDATQERPAGANSQQAGQSNQQGQAGRPGNLDKHIAACALLSNQEEVALAKLGVEKADHEDVKKFAEMLIEHHQQAISKIEKAAPQLASMNLMLRNADGDSQPAANEQQAGAMDPQLMMARQIKEECLAMTRKALNEKEGADFDKAFLGQQCMAHMGMLAGIKGSEPFASQQMKPLLNECMKTTEQHLTKAKELMEKVKDKDAPRQARAGE